MRHRSLSRVATIAGLALITLAAWLWWQHFSAPPVYRYIVGEALATGDAGPMSPYLEAGITVRRVSVMSTEQPAPLATLDIAESPHGPVLLDWQARVDDPFLTLSAPPEDVAALSVVLKKHVPQDAAIFAWWDSSRQFQTLAKVDIAFSQHLGVPLFVPSHWRSRRDNVEAIEQAFWNSNPPAGTAAQRQRFLQFAQALVAPEEQGVAMLRSLGDGKRVVLALHMRDVILLGQMFPDKIGVAFQDFGGSTDVHSMVRRVHAWLEEHKYSAYGVIQGKNRPIRAVALTDAPSSKTLVARLLPFLGNEQHDVAGTTLVYQAGGFSVFEVTPGDNTASASSLTSH